MIHPVHRMKLKRLNGPGGIKGKLQLNGVQLTERKPANYKVTFYGATVELKDKGGMGS